MKWPSWETILFRGSLWVGGAALCGLFVSSYVAEKATAPPPVAQSLEESRFERYREYSLRRVGPDEHGVACYLTGSVSISCVKVK